MEQIDDGARGGIPKELWASVITIFRDAKRIEAFTGTENPMPARVILLDATGKVLWYHDRGFSPVLLQELDAKIRDLAAGCRGGRPHEESSHHLDQARRCNKVR